MRILALQETDWVARNPIMHHRMLEELSRRGDDVTVIDYDLHWQSAADRRPSLRRRSGRAVGKYFDDARITLIRPPMVRLPGISRVSWLAANWREVRWEIDRRRPDVIVGYGISNALLAARMARRAGIPFVYHLLDALHTLVEPAILRPVARRVEQLALREADRVIVINKHLSTYAIEMGAVPSRIFVLPQGYTPRAVAPDERERVRGRLGVAEDELLLLFVGWLYEFSGLRELAHAFAQRKQEFERVKLAIVGSGDLEVELAAIQSTDLHERLLLVGQRPVTEIPELIGAADICLLPALRTPAMKHIVPSKVGEYLELGKPVVATRLPGMLEEFSGVPGVLWIDTPDQVLDHVAELGRRAQGARQAAELLGSTCHAWASSRDDWATATTRFRDLLLGEGTSATAQPEILELGSERAARRL